MPLIYDADIVRSLYWSPGGTIDGVEQPGRTYSRATRDESMYAARVDRLLEAGIPTDASVLVVGCGFGFLIEALHAAGFRYVAGIEPGPYYWTQPNEWDPAVRAVVAQRWLTDQGPEAFDVVIDEDAASSHSDSELDVFFAALERVGSRVVHFVTPGIRGDSSLNWKTLETWKALAPKHDWFGPRG